MKQVQVSIICDFFKLGVLLEKPKLISSKGLWCLRTIKGYFALKKLSTKNLYQDAAQGELIAAAFSKSNIPAVCALSFKNKSILEIDKEYFMIFPWVQGQVVNTFSIFQCYRLGKLLGKIHKVNLKLDNINEATWYKCIELNWCNLFEKIPYNLNVTLEELVSWDSQYKNALPYLSKEKVISHGDLSQSNIIWQSLKQPVLIDWEAAGWLHPQVELLGVALNCSDFISNNFSHKKFLAVIKGYFSVTFRVAINEYVLHAGLGSWLNWLSFNLIQTSVCNQNVSLEVQNTVRAIRQLIGVFPKLMSSINFLQEYLDKGIVMSRIAFP